MLCVVFFVVVGACYLLVLLMFVDGWCLLVAGVVVAVVCRLLFAVCHVVVSVSVLSGVLCSLSFGVSRCC